MPKIAAPRSGRWVSPCLPDPELIVQDAIKRWNLTCSAPMMNTCRNGQYARPGSRIPIEPVGIHTRRYGWFVYQCTFRSSRCVILGLAAGVAGRAADQVGHRRRPVFGPQAGTPGPRRGRDGGPAAAANTAVTHVRLREGSNTRITRTKRHYPAHVGTPAKMASQAPDRPIAGKAGCGAVSGRGSRVNDRPSVKR